MASNLIATFLSRNLANLGLARGSEGRLVEEDLTSNFNLILIKFYILFLLASCYY